MTCFLSYSDRAIHMWGLVHSPVDLGELWDDGSASRAGIRAQANCMRLGNDYLVWLEPSRRLFASASVAMSA